MNGVILFRSAQHKTMRKEKSQFLSMKQKQRHSMLQYKKKQANFFKIIFLILAIETIHLDFTSFLI